MSSYKEREDRLSRSDKAATATLQHERAAREAKTAKLRAMRIEQEANGRPPIAEARRRKPGS